MMTAVCSLSSVRNFSHVQVNFSDILFFILVQFSNCDILWCFWIWRGDNRRLVTIFALFASVTKARIQKRWDFVKLGTLLHNYVSSIGWTTSNFLPMHWARSFHTKINLPHLPLGLIALGHEKYNFRRFSATVLKRRALLDAHPQTDGIIKGHRHGAKGYYVPSG